MTLYSHLDLVVCNKFKQTTNLEKGNKNLLSDISVTRMSGGKAIRVIKYIPELRSGYQLDIQISLG